MLRIRLMTAVAAAAVLAAPAVLAQTTPPGVQPAPTNPAEPVMPGQTPPPSVNTPSPVAPPPAPGQDTVPAPAATATPAAAATRAPPAADAMPAQANNVIDVMTAHGDFTMLLAALDKAGLTQVLKSRAAVSVFAPTDAAFAALPEADRTRLMDPAHVAELRQLLLHHVIVADVEEAQIRGHAGPVETASGATVQLDGTGDGIKVGAAMVTGARLDASNGAVFALDHVLTAPAAGMAPPATAPATPTAATPPADESAPAAETPAAATETTMPAQPGENAPNGQPAATTTTTASPPVHNPTDGQVDSQPDPARTTPPIQTPDPADGDADGAEPSTTTTPTPPTPPAA